MKMVFLSHAPVLETCFRHGITARRQFGEIDDSQVSVRNYETNPPSPCFCIRSWKYE